MTAIANEFFVTPVCRSAETAIDMAFEFSEAAFPGLPSLTDPHAGGMRQPAHLGQPSRPDPGPADSLSDHKKTRISAVRTAKPRRKLPGQRMGHCVYCIPGAISANSVYLAEPILSKTIEYYGI